MAEDGVQRRKLYESISAPLEKISIKILLEFKLQAKVTQQIESLTAAIVKLIGEVDQSIEIPLGKQGWAQSQDAMSKPGHFINALRRFPYAVDSGRITAACASDLKTYVESGCKPGEEDSHPAAFLLHDWAHAAYQYHLLKLNSKSSVAEPNIKTKKGGTPTGTTKSKIDDPNKRQAYNKKPNTNALNAKSPPSSGSTTTSGPRSGDSNRGINNIKTTNLSSSGLRSQHGSGRPGSGRPGSSSGLKTAPNLLNTPGSNIGTNNNINLTSKPENSPMLFNPDGPGNRSAMATGPRGASGPGPGPGGPASAPNFLTTNLNSDARRLALGGLPDWAIEIEQMKREVRELKSQEAKATWDLRRQEKQAMNNMKKQSEQDLANWRTQQAREMKELEESKGDEQKKNDLEENRQFVAFKKERKKLERAENSTRIEEEYLKTKNQAEWREECEKKTKEEYLLRQKELEEKHQIDREIKQRKRQEDKAYEEASREHNRQLEIEKMRKDLAAEREELMKRVNYAKDSMNKMPTNSTGEEFWSSK